MRFCLVFLMLVCLTLSAVAAPLVQNGDFALSNGGSGALDWVGGGRNTGSTGNTPGVGVLILNTSFPGFGSSSQTGETVAGQLYELTSFYSSSNGVPIVSWNGTPLIAFQTFVSTTNASYRGQRFFVTGSGTDTLTFTGQTLTTVIDDVSLVAVPEISPDGSLGLTFSLLLLALGRRRPASRPTELAYSEPSSPLKHLGPGLGRTGI